jgi:cobalt-zinc-cadmium efflux system membrane fusion protein
VTAIPDRVFNARVVAIGAGSDPQTHRVLVRSEIANSDRALRAEMFANFSIIIRDERPSPAVPAAALERDGSDVWVWVRNTAGAFEQRFVEVGAQDNDRVEIVKGVAVGEQVVSRGGIYIEPRPR